MTPATRTRLGIGLFVPLAAALLATFACLPAPVGDPDQSAVDESLSGAWLATPKDAGPRERIVVLLRPWDKHTYFVQYIAAETRDGKETRQMLHFKGWLTAIGGATFLTCQPMDDAAALVGDAPKEKPYWAVFRVDKTPAGLNAQMVQPDSDWMKGLSTREAVEGAIKAHVNDKALYGDVISFRKLGKADAASLDDLLSTFTGGQKPAIVP